MSIKFVSCETNMLVCGFSFSNELHCEILLRIGLQTDHQEIMKQIEQVCVGFQQNFNIIR